MKLDINAKELYVVESYLDKLSDFQTLNRLSYKEFTDIEKTRIVPAMRKLIEFGMANNVLIKDDNREIDLRYHYDNIVRSDYDTLRSAHQASQMYRDLIDEYRNAEWCQNNLNGDLV